MSVPGTRLEDVVSDAFEPLDVKTVVLALWGFGGPRVHCNTVPLAGRDGLAPPPVGPLSRLLIEANQVECNLGITLFVLVEFRDVFGPVIEVAQAVDVVGVVAVAVVCLLATVV